MSFGLRALAVSVLFSAALGYAQQGGVLKGQVVDETRGPIPGAQLVLRSDTGVEKRAGADENGAYSFTDLAPGHYLLRATSTGFAPYVNTVVNIVAGRPLTLDVTLKLTMAKQEVTVSGETAGTVSTEASANAGALTLKGTDLEALSDDPDDLAADLQALAGPSAGPNGGQIYIDGFSGAQLPPKASIREIRINQNPFSAEYDRLGFGRIEVLTKPGSDRFHGQTFFNFSDSSFNSRNPFSTNESPFQARLYGGNVGGPLTKRASFFLDFERREIDDASLVYAKTLDANLNPVTFNESLLTPQRRTSITPRLDYQLSQNHTLVVRYNYRRIGRDNQGLNGFNLPSQAYSTLDEDHTLQVTETAILSPKVINETRLQFRREMDTQNGDNTLPEINVLQSFVGGGPQVGNSYDRSNHWELQNYTSLAEGAHAIKFGVRARAITLSDYSPQNFGGTFTFGGGLAPQLDASNRIVLGPDAQPVMTEISSLERYRRTLYFLQQGLTVPQMQAFGGGPTQFAIAAGNPLTSLNQFDVGVFVQDDWRLRQNVTLSLGLRYETQTNIHDWRDLGPRVGVAWAPKLLGGKTVFRGGAGVFYDRFDSDYVLNAMRYNGRTQQSYLVTNPTFYPNVPAVADLAASAQRQTINQVDPDLRAPYIAQAALGVERQLPHSTTVASTFTFSHGVHMLRSRDINAPLPGTNVRPYGLNDIYQYESTGHLNQKQWITNVNSRFSKRFSLSGYYVLNYARSDTDGAGTFPANPYDLSAEYGRAAYDIRHRFIVFGSINAPLRLQFAPFVVANSGRPFNITTGRDPNGDGVFTDRPAVASNLSAPGVVMTPFGAFDPNPQPGEVLLPRNFAEAPGSYSINLRLSRTFGFGKPAGDRGANSGGGGGFRGPRGGGPGAMMMGGGGGGFHGMFGGGESTGRRYNLTLSVMVHNLLNHTNPGTPVGNLSSPYFGESLSLAGGFGPGAVANNRRLDLQLRFAF